MKTCSFRGAEPRSSEEGLLCRHDPSETSYRMTPCGNSTCLCCHPLNIEKRSQSWVVVDFNASLMHRFVNGYTTYLNCPAVCLRPSYAVHC